MILRFATIVVFALGCSVPVTAADAYLPLAFHAEEREIKTTACLRVVESVYPQTTAWNGFGKADLNEAEKSFEAVVTAIRQKNRNRLLELSDPSAAQQPQEFNTQAAAFFSQFERLQLAAVPRAYGVDGLAIFFADFRSGLGGAFAPLVFRSQANGTFRFLPSRTRQIAYTLVKEWFDSPWGPSQTSSPGYCTSAEIARATHRVSLSPTPSNSVIAPSTSLYLRAAPLQSDIAGRATSAIARIQSTVASGSVDSLLPLMTPAGANQLKQWFDKADAKERTTYIKSLGDFMAFFVYDAAPLIIVYGRESSGNVRVLYFTPGTGSTLLWTNSSHLTSADEVFKGGVLLREASVRPPFNDIQLK